MVASLLALCLLAAPAEVVLTGTVSTARAATRRTAILTDRHVCSGGFESPERIEAGPVPGAIVFLAPLSPKTTELSRAWLSLSPQKRPRPKGSLLIDQIRCRFVPAVSAAVVGSEVYFGNSDPLFHNVHALSGDRTLANFAMPVQGQRTLGFVAGGPDWVRLRCDAGHDWMSAEILVFDHEFFTTTDARGVFRLPELPRGQARIAVFHPLLGVESRVIELGTGDKAVALRFGAEQSLNAP